MADNSINILFWLLAVAGVVSAMGAVTFKKSFYVVSSVALNTAAVAGLMMYLGYVWFGVWYLTLAAAAAVILYFALGKKLLLHSQLLLFQTDERAGRYFIVALLIFAGCLALIANTGVWRYAGAERSSSIAEFWSSLLENHSLLMIFTAVFVTLLAFIMLSKSRHKAN